jgi:hypothetical protein
VATPAGISDGAGVKDMDGDGRVDGANNFFDKPPMLPAIRLFRFALPWADKCGVERPMSTSPVVAADLLKIYKKKYYDLN